MGALPDLAGPPVPPQVGADRSLNNLGRGVGGLGSDKRWGLSAELPLGGSGEAVPSHASSAGSEARSSAPSAPDRRREPLIGQSVLVSQSREDPSWSIPANRQHRGWLSVGGRLSRSSDRLVFRPNALDRMFLRAQWSCHLRNIRAVGVAGRSFRGGPFSGGAVRRLRLDLVDGSTELFVVQYVDLVADRIRNELDAR